ncbi:MAG: hypothetical protein MZU91_08140 [Desulfosudis oleivorans]|nr:hypothetical protein [Desulfosudis oleivorans]
MDVPARGGVRAHAAPRGVTPEQNLFTCSQDSQERMKQTIAEHRLNRVVVAACSPKTHEGIFMDTLEATGLQQVPAGDGQHPQPGLLGAQRRSRRAPPPRPRTWSAWRWPAPARSSRCGEKVIPVNQRALVIGGGVAGMNAALSHRRPGLRGGAGRKGGPPGRHGQPACTTPSRAGTCSATCRT